MAVHSVKERNIKQAPHFEYDVKLDLRIIRTGYRPLGQISRYMDGPNLLTELLVAPDDLGPEVDGGLALDVFSSAVKRLSRIEDYVGLKGIDVEDICDIPYEESLAQHFTIAADTAWYKDRPVITGWFIPNLELMEEQHVNPDDVMSAIPSIASRTGQISGEGAQLVTTRESNWKLTCSEKAGKVFAYQISRSTKQAVGKDDALGAVRPVALVIYPEVA